MGEIILVPQPSDSPNDPLSVSIPAGINSTFPKPSPSAVVHDMEEHADDHLRRRYRLAFRQLLSVGFARLLEVKSGFLWYGAEQSLAVCQQRLSGTSVSGMPQVFREQFSQ